MSEDMDCCNRIISDPLITQLIDFMCICPGQVKIAFKFNLHTLQRCPHEASQPYYCSIRKQSTLYKCTLTNMQGHGIERAKPKTGMVLQLRGCSNVLFQECFKDVQDNFRQQELVSTEESLFNPSIICQSS